MSGEQAWNISNNHCGNGLKCIIVCHIRSVHLFLVVCWSISAAAQNAYIPALKSVIVINVLLVSGTS